MTQKYAKAEEELAWYFLERDALGVSAQNIEGGGGAVVFDDARSHRLHMSKRTPRHRQNMEREATITPTVWLLSAADVSTAALAYETYGCDAQVRNLFNAERQARMVGLLLVTPTIIDRRMGSPSEAVVAIDKALKAGGQPRWLLDGMREAEGIFSGILSRYEPLRVERNERVRDARQNRTRAILDEHAARLRGEL